MQCWRPGFDPCVGRFRGKGSGNPLQYSCLENCMTEEPGRLHSMGSQRVRQDWATNTFTFTHFLCLLCGWNEHKALKWCLAQSNHWIDTSYYYSCSIYYHHYCYCRTRAELPKSSHHITDGEIEVQRRILAWRQQSQDQTLTLSIPYTVIFPLVCAIKQFHSHFSSSTPGLSIGFKYSISDQPWNHGNWMANWKGSKQISLQSPTNDIIAPAFKLQIFSAFRPRPFSIAFVNLHVVCSSISISPHNIVARIYNHSQSRWFRAKLQGVELPLKAEGGVPVPSHSLQKGQTAWVGF